MKPSPSERGAATLISSPTICSWTRIFSTRGSSAGCRIVEQLFGRVQLFGCRCVGDAELEAKRETAINAYMASMLARSEITPRPSASTA